MISSVNHVTKADSVERLQAAWATVLLRRPLESCVVRNEGPFLADPYGDVKGNR